MENIYSASDRLTALKARLAKLERKAAAAPAALSGATQDTLATGVLHDLYAETPADAVAVNAFALGLALRAAGERPIVWGLHDLMRQETGRPYGPGLHEMGLKPADLLLVRARDILTLLAVGEEALRSPAVGAVLLSAWGEAGAFSLTASRRLALAAEAGGATLFLARAGAAPAPGAAETRWQVRAVASTPLEGGCPGRPSFSATLLRHRGGAAPRTWIMEWDRERRSFIEPAPLSGDLVPVAAHRSVAA